MIHNIEIRPVLNGFIASVGCQTLVFQSRGDLVTSLDRYLREPEQVEKDFRKGAVNAYLLQQPAQGLAAPPPATVCENTAGRNRHIDQPCMVPTPVGG